MNEKFSLKLLIILDEPIRLSDLFKRSSRAKIDGFELELPEIRVDTASPGTVSIIAGIPNFRFKKVLKGHDLLTFNLVYPNQKRGGFQVEFPNADDITSSQELYNGLNEVVEKLGYKGIYAYELSINMIISILNSKDFTEVDKFETMKSPKYGALRILDGDNGSKDLREEFISDIKVEKLTQPAKYQVSCLNRTRDFDNNIIEKLFNDIDKILNFMR